MEQSRYIPRRKTKKPVCASCGNRSTKTRIPQKGPWKAQWKTMPDHDVCFQCWRRFTERGGQV